MWSLCFFVPSRRECRIRIAISTTPGRYIADANKLPPQLFHLLEIDLRGRSNISDVDLAHFKGLHQLTDLNLQGTRITDEGLRHLQGLTTLNRLDLSQTRITDAGLKSLKSLNQLSTLVLDRTQVTDKGFDELKLLEFLANLDVHGTKVTEAGANAFEKSHRRGIQIHPDSSTAIASVAPGPTATIPDPEQPRITPPPKLNPPTATTPSPNQLPAVHPEGSPHAIANWVLAEKGSIIIQGRQSITKVEQLPNTPFLIEGITLGGPLDQAAAQQIKPLDNLLELTLTHAEIDPKALSQIEKLAEIRLLIVKKLLRNNNYRLTLNALERFHKNTPWCRVEIAGGTVLDPTQYPQSQGGGPLPSRPNGPLGPRPGEPGFRPPPGVPRPPGPPRP